MPTKLLHCVCKNSYQDEVYDGKRVFNQTKGSEGKIYRCSVCRKELSIGGGEDSKKSVKAAKAVKEKK